MTRRVYSPKFERGAAQLVVGRSVVVAQASKDLGVHTAFDGHTKLMCWHCLLPAQGSVRIHEI